MQGDLPLSDFVLGVANPTLKLLRGAHSTNPFTLAVGKSLFTLNLKFARYSGSCYRFLPMIQMPKKRVYIIHSSTSLYVLECLLQTPFEQGPLLWQVLLTHFPNSFSFLQLSELFFAEFDVPSLHLLSCLEAQEWGPSSRTLGRQEVWLRCSSGQHVVAEEDWAILGHCVSDCWPKRVLMAVPGFI